MLLYHLGQRMFVDCHGGAQDGCTLPLRLLVPPLHVVIRPVSALIVITERDRERHTLLDEPVRLARHMLYHVGVGAIPKMVWDFGPLLIFWRS